MLLGLEMTITKFSIEYDAVNSKNVFTNGDTLNGRIVVRASKDSPIRSLVLLAMGVAGVHWTEDEESFNQDKEYYKIKHYILKESREDAPTVIGKGSHVFPFSFKFPDRDIPTSFQSSFGRVLHGLQAQLKRTKKLTRWATANINFISKPNVNIPRLMEPQHGSTVKTFRIGSGIVLMDVYIEHQGYKQGEALWVTLKVSNTSSRKMRPRFALCDEQTFITHMKTKQETHKIMMKTGKVVKPYKTETVTKMFDIPDNLTPSTLNCTLIELQYWLKVYLDTPFAISPKVKLPIVLLPSFDVPMTERSPATAAAGLEMQRIMQPGSALPEEPPPAYEDCVVGPYAHGGAAATTGFFF